MKLREKFNKTMKDRRAVAKGLKEICAERRTRLEEQGLFDPVKEVDVIAAVRVRIEALAHLDELQKRGDKIRADYRPLFEQMPPTNNLPTEVLCEIKIKDANAQFQARSYQSPRKYKDAWRTLIQGHLDAGRIRPSSSPYSSPAFLIPKADKSALPR
jgi:hypothetical protein